MDHDPRCCARLDPEHPRPVHPDPTRHETAEAAADVPTHRASARRDSVRVDPDADPAQVGPLGAHRSGERVGVDWLAAQMELDECDGYVVLAVDPQTGEVDAHGPFLGFDALEAAQSMRETLDREELADVVVRIVRWHLERPGQAA